MTFPFQYSYNSCTIIFTITHFNSFPIFSPDKLSCRILDFSFFCCIMYRLFLSITYIIFKHTSHFSYFLIPFLFSLFVFIFISNHTLSSFTLKSSSSSFSSPHPVSPDSTRASVTAWVGCVWKGGGVELRTGGLPTHAAPPIPPTHPPHLGQSYQPHPVTLELLRAAARLTLVCVDA